MLYKVLCTLLEIGMDIKHQATGNIVVHGKPSPTGLLKYVSDHFTIPESVQESSDSAYPNVEFNEMLDTVGDSFARYKLRISEMWESLRIIEQLIDNIPEGEHKAKTKAVIKLPKGEFYQKVETARGEFGVYIISEGGKSPYRLKFRSPGFSNLNALNAMASGSKIADLVAIMSTLDLVIPDIDR